MKVRLRRLVANRYVGVLLVVFLGTFVVLAALGQPGRWPLYELGRRTSFALGCRTLSCVPLVLGLSVLYTVGTAVGVGALLRAGRDHGE